MSPLDQAEKGQVLRWSRHPWLGEIAEALGRPDLAYEPTVHGAEEVTSELLDLQRGVEGVGWGWNSWSGLRVKLCPPVGFSLPEETRQWPRGSCSSLRWKELPLWTRIELTPYRRDGSEGATLCLPRPTTISLLRCKWAYEQRDSGDGVRIQIPPLATKLRPRTLELVALELTASNSIFQKVKQCSVHGGKGFVPLWAGFRGVIALIAQNAHTSVCLLDLMGVPARDSLGRILDDQEWFLVRRAVGDVAARTTPDLEGWPERSRRYLMALHDTAQALVLDRVEELSRSYPRGVFRAVVLRLAHGEIPVWDERILGRLQAQTGAEAVLAEWMGETWPYFARFPAAQERIWLLHNRFSKGLGKVIDWVAPLGGRGAQVLERAKQHLATKSRLDQVIQRIRPECPEAAAAAMLIRNLDRGILDGGVPQDLELRLRGLEQRLRSEDGPGPPIDIEKFEQWQRREQARHRWRSEAHAVLAFCERGEWPCADDSEMDIEHLAQRACALEQITGDWTGCPPLDAQTLTRRVGTVIKDRQDEPESEYRETVLRILEQRVLASAQMWSELHGLIRKAAEIAQSFPRLAADLGFTAGGGASLMERAHKARAVTDLMRELPAAMASIEPLSSSPEQRSAILTAPGHQALAKALEEQRRLRRLLEEDPELPPQPEEPAHGPELHDVEAYLAWWRQLARVSEDLSQLRIRYSDLKRFSRGLVADLDRAGPLPAKSQHETDELKRCLERGEPSWKQISQLVSLLQQAGRQNVRR